MRRVLACLSCLACFLWSSALSVLHAEGQPSPAKASTYQGLAVSLAIATTECRIGKPLEATVMFVAAGGYHKLFNPFFNRLLELPGRIIIRDKGGNIVNRLLEFHEGSRRLAGEGDYVLLLDGGFVGTKLSINPSLKYGGSGMLAPGDYTMQLILSGVALGFSGNERFREVATSERIAFRLVK